MLPGQLIFIYFQEDKATFVLKMDKVQILIQECKNNQQSSKYCLKFFFR